MNATALGDLDGQPSVLPGQAVALEYDEPYRIMLEDQPWATGCILTEAWDPK